MKHYELQPRIYHGYKVHRLLSLDDSTLGDEYQPYTMFMEGLVSRGHSTTTIHNYGHWLACFLDYIREGEIQRGGMNSAILRELIIGYHSYLIYGCNAQDNLIKAISNALPSPRVTPQTSSLYHVPIKHFLQDSEEYHSNLLDAVHTGLANPLTADSHTLFSTTSARATTQINQRKAINQHAVIAAVVRGGTKMKTKSLFKHVPSLSGNNSDYDDYKHFPLNKIPLVIHEATSYRNSAIWSLIAATGLRPNEALQLLWEDIDFDAFEVVAIDPNKRNNLATSYKGLSESEIKRLTWKSRKTKHTLLLEPFATVFFEYLQNYIASEYICHGRHNFVFQTSRGSPLFLSDYGSNILAPFHSAQRRILQNDAQSHKTHDPLKFHIDRYGYLGLHSLRHSYCFFLKNYARNPDGTQGLTDSQIMLLTGHCDVRSVTKYAKLEHEHLRTIISHANQVILNDGLLSIDEYRLDYLAREMERLRKKLSIEDDHGTG